MNVNLKVNTKSDFGLDKSHKKKRKDFSKSTKEIEWKLSKGKCRRCRRVLRKRIRGYNFDHLNSKSWDNRPQNCRLLCSICHDKVTIPGKKKAIKNIIGQTTGYETKMKRKKYHLRGKRKKKRNQKSTKPTSNKGVSVLNLNPNNILSNIGR